MADKDGMTTITLSDDHSFEKGDTISMELTEQRVWKWIVAFIFRLPRPIKTERFTIVGVSESVLSITKYHWWNRYVH